MDNKFAFAPRPAARRFRPLARLAGAALLVLPWACQSPPKEQPTAATAAAPAAPPVDTLAALVLRPQQLTKQTALPGELRAYQRVELRAKIPAFVRQMRADIGSVVRKGQVLAVLDAPESRARLAAATAAIRQAEARAEGSAATYKRTLAAAENPGVMAATEVDRVRAVAEADAASASAARAEAASLRDLENYLTLRAPFDGIVTERNADVGALVGNGAGPPLLVVEQIGRLRLRVDVPEAATGKAAGQKGITFTVKAFPGQPFKATLARQAASLRADTRSETWEFDVPNPGGQLKPGMFATVQLPLARARDSFYVPFAAVATTLEKSFVIRVRHGRAEWVDAAKGTSFPDQVEIFGPVQAGDTLLLRATEELKPDTKVVARVGAAPASTK
jgi:membrane fusion protein (multidrug efflux system)